MLERVKLKTKKKENTYKSSKVINGSKLKRLEEIKKGLTMKKVSMLIHMKLTMCLAWMTRRKRKSIESIPGEVEEEAGVTVAEVDTKEVVVMAEAEVIIRKEIMKNDKSMKKRREMKRRKLKKLSMREKKIKVNNSKN